MPQPLTKSPRLELRAIKTLTQAPQNVRSYLLSSLNPECFDWSPTQEAFTRIATLARERGMLCSWEEILQDPILTNDSRQALEDYTKKPLQDKADVQRLIGLLHKYRRIRVLNAGARHVIKQLQSESIDIDRLVQHQSDVATAARMSGDVEDWFLRIGSKDQKHRKAAAQVVKDVLRPKARLYIPTGFKAFDNLNLGIFRGSAWLISGTTGGGKSTIANQIRINMARSGAKVGFVPLEMNMREMMQRRLANIGNFPMQQILDAENMPENDVAHLVKAFKKYRARIERVGGADEDFVPEEDMTIEDVLYALRPYGYDIIVIDYVGLLKGMSGDRQWERLAEGLRFAKRFATINNAIVCVCAQFDQDGIVRYSRGMVENATNAWTWVYDEAARETGICEIKQPKARQQRSFNFPLVFDFEHMRVRDLTEEEKNGYTSNDYRDSTRKSNAHRSEGESNDGNRGSRRSSSQSGKSNSSWGHGSRQSTGRSAGRTNSGSRDRINSDDDYYRLE